MGLEFTCLGVPQPAGSKTGFHNKQTGRTWVVDAAKKSKPWKLEVASAARAAMLAQGATGEGLLLNGPLTLDVSFHMPRPKGHFGARGLRPSAPDYPTTRPDVTKLLRAVEDALTGVVWRDDAQVIFQYARKLYGEPARVEVAIHSARP
jgi:Holliday junction resolvase RusA-like endonuclease